MDNDILSFFGEHMDALPIYERLENEVFYEPSDNGYEQTIRNYLDDVKKWRAEQERHKRVL